MSIWQPHASLEGIRQRVDNTMCSYLKIAFTEMGDDFLVAKMPVDHTTQQPLGYIHGGASCVLAETVGSVASNCCIDPEKFYAVGLEINANHIRPATEGFVTGTARPIHLGRKTHVWDIQIQNDAGKITCVSRLTMAVLAKASQS